MATSTPWIALALGILCAARAHANDRDPEKSLPRYQIEEIRTRAFFHEYGLFDDRELQDPKLALWNVNTGSLHLRANTSATLVLVDVSGASFKSDAKGAVELSAMAEGHELLQHAVPILDLFTEKREVTVPFLVYGTGCGDLEIKARVRLEGKVAAEKQAVVPFRCGE